MTNRLIVDDLVRDLSEWMAHCHTDDVVLEQLLQRLFYTTRFIDVLSMYKRLAGILMERFPNTILPTTLLQTAIEHLHMKKNQMHSVNSAEGIRTGLTAIRTFMMKLRELKESTIAVERATMKATLYRFHRPYSLYTCTPLQDTSLHIYVHCAPLLFLLVLLCHCPLPAHTPPAHRPTTFNTASTVPRPTAMTPTLQTHTVKQ